MWIKGKILKIIERDPIFEVAPENYMIAYLVEGNKTISSKETITLSYQTIEKIIPREHTPAEQPNKNITKDLSKNLQKNP